MEQKHDLEDLRKPHVGDYPRALYKYVGSGKGDLKSPAYEKIVTNDAGIASRFPEKHHYVTRSVKDVKEEKEFLKEGWELQPPAERLTEAA